MLTRGLLLAAGLCVRMLTAASPVVTIDLNSTVVKSFTGLGVQWDPYEFPPTPEAWKLTLTRLDHMRPAIFRVMWRAAYSQGFDAQGNPRYIWDQGDAAADKRLAPLYALLDYAEAREIDVMLGEWGWPREMTGPADLRWARIIRDFVLYLRTHKKYTVIKLYNYVNEPNGGWTWPGHKVDYEAWATGIRNLRREFDANGLASLPIAGPDNSGSWDWIDRSAHDLRNEIGAWEMHWYAKDREVVEGEVQKLLEAKRQVLLATDPKAATKRLYMGEAGLIDGRCNGDQQPRVKEFVYGVLMADYVAQVARAGWEGAIAWDLDDALHAVSGQHRPTPPDPLTLKVWGFWNTQARAMGTPEDEAIRPWYFTWSLMSRLFPKGSRIVRASEADGAGVRTMAAEWKTGGERQMSVMLVNDHDAAPTVEVRVPGADSHRLVEYRYFERDCKVDPDGFPAAASRAKAAWSKGIEVSLPARGVVFLTTTQ